MRKTSIPEMFDKSPEFHYIMLGVYFVCFSAFLTSIFPALEIYVTFTILGLVLGALGYYAYKNVSEEYLLYRDINDPIETVIERHKKEGLM